MTRRGRRTFTAAFKAKVLLEALKEFHALLALTDALRVGRVRERAEAAKELAKRLK